MTVTVFVTVYNVAEYLPRFFRCMAEQTYQDYGLLIFDDGSEDDTLKICMEHAAQDARIRVVHSEHIGIAAARNRVLAMIETPFAASADGDDVYEKDYLRHLVEAQAKYDADLVIDRVVYRSEDYQRISGFPPRGEMLIEKQDYPEMMPELLDERRLNYLYGKLYRSALLKECRVEDDVKHGSDTMFNSQYVLKTDRIVLIDDEDANYIRYASRAVTSYRGPELFGRLSRIDLFVADVFRNSWLWNEKMCAAIDKRLLSSAAYTVREHAKLHVDLLEQYDAARAIARSDAYIEARERQKARPRNDAIRLIEAGEEIEFVNQVNGLQLVEAKELRDLRGEVHRLANSNSWKIGRVITFPVRMLKDICRRLRG